MISPNFKFIRGLEKSPKFHKIFSIISSKDLKLNFVLGIALYCGLFHHPVMIRTYHYYKCSGCRIILLLTNMILQHCPVSPCLVALHLHIQSFIHICTLQHTAHAQMHPLIHRIFIVKNIGFILWWTSSKVCHRCYSKACGNILLCISNHLTNTCLNIIDNENCKVSATFQDWLAKRR